ncbi:MAG: hypothetical protein DCF22_00620 [Leptolyngbya sp.]|nr:MAG: hypothetical protein DCF22_00620 [Leptolyngbya sp.]
MPTNLLLETNAYEGSTSVLVTLEGVRSPRMLTMDLTSIAPDANGKKYIQPGTLAVKKANGLGAPLKVSKLTAAVTTSATDLVVSNAALFKAGDVLTIPTPYARLDLAGTWANADTATLTLGGQSALHTVASYTSLTALATALATTFTASLGSKASFIAEGAYIHIFGSDFLSISKSITVAGNGTLTIADAVTTLQGGVTVETIASIDLTTGTLTLSGAVDRRLPALAPLGVLASTDVIYGLIPSLIDLDETSNDVAIFTSCTVYGDRLPYWDSFIAKLLPEITLLTP